MKRLPEVAALAVHIERRYVRFKSAIPSDSYWFTRRFRHKSWFTTSDLERTQALNTGTPVSPEMVPHHHWVEDLLFPVVRLSLRNLLRAGDFDGAISVCSAVDDAAQVMTKLFATDEALRLVEIISSEVDAVAASDQGGLSLFQRSVLVDVVGKAVISLALGLRERADTLTADAFAVRVSRALDTGDVYRLNLDRSSVEVVENLRKALEFEIEVESRRLTPDWFTNHMAARSTISTVDRHAKSVFEALDQMVVGKAEQHADSGNIEIASSYAERGLEACSKARGQRRAFRESIDSLLELKRIEDDSRWPKTPGSSWPADIEGMESRLVKVLARVLPDLATPDMNDEEPDRFGHAYAVLNRQLFITLADGNDSAFADLFGPFFDALYAAHSRVEKEVRNEGSFEVVVSYVAEPFVALSEISGYAMLFAELFDNRSWEICRSKWDDYLADQEHSILVNQIPTVMNISSRIFGIKPGDLARTSRKQEFESVLMARGVVDQRMDGPLLFEDKDEEPIHSSASIRVFAPDHLGGGMHDVEDLFVVEYLSKRPEWSSELSSSAERLAEALEDEREAGNEPQA